MTPTERRFDAIYDIGCIACRKRGYSRPCQVQHLNLGGLAGQKQLGHSYTIGLCPWHHQAVKDFGYCSDEMRIKLGPSLAQQSKLFRETFGTDDELLAYQNQLIAERKAAA